MKYSRRWRLHIWSWGKIFEPSFRPEMSNLSHILQNILSTYILSNKNLFPPPLVTSRAVREVNSETEKFAQSEEQRFVSYHLNHLCSAPGNLIRKVKKWKSTRILLQSANTPNSFPNSWFQLLTLCKLLKGQKTTSFGVFLPFFSQILHFHPFHAHIKPILKKRIRPGLHFSAVVEAQTFCLNSGRVATATQLTNINIKRWK